MLLQHAIFILGVTAAVCANPLLEYDLSIKKSRNILSHPATKIGEHRSAPFYYVSYDPYESTCTEERCNDVAELFLKSVKKSVDPCDDFYAYACGRKQSKMRALTKEIQEILEERSMEKQEMKSLAVEKMFYQSCMEQQESDEKTKREFTRLLEVSSGLDLFRPDNARPGKRDWQSSDAFYTSLGFEPAFFNAHVTRDPEAIADDVNLITLSPPSLQYLYSVHRLLKMRNFTDIVSHLLGDFNKNGRIFVTDFEDVIEFNNALHEILPPLGMIEENITMLINSKMTIEEWQDMYDSDIGNHFGRYHNKVHWLRVLNGLTKSANVHMFSDDKIIVRAREYFKKLAQLLEKTPASTIKKYVHLKFLTQIGKYLSPKLARFFETVHDRSSFCIKQSDNRLVAATYEYIKRHVPRKQKIHAETAVESIRNALIDLLTNIEWMDDATKLHAVKKLQHLDIEVGYPEWQINRTLVNNYYGNLRLHSNFFENIIKYKRKAMFHEFHGLRTPRMFDPSTMSKKLVPLIYHFEISSNLNRILFPTEYLNEKKYKLFSPKLPRAINYGSFGSMLGSILYDYVSLTDNLKYNEFYVRTAEGLSKDTIDAYKVKEKCLSNQLINYKKSSIEFDQPLAADTIQIDKIYEKMVGLQAAFNAYKKMESDDVLLPGFENMSNDQLFFLSYAERICEIGDIYDRYDFYEPSLKVNGVLSNLEVFSDVFHCSRHSPMNRETKCGLFS